MENKIKVKVSYEQPATTKFDALLKEYEVAKKVAEETVAYYKPLADVAEDAKFEIVLEQIETLKKYVEKVCEISDKSECFYWYGGDFMIGHSPNNLKVRCTLRGESITKENFAKNRTNLTWQYMLRSWESGYKEIERLICERLQELIKKEESKGQREIDRLKAITE